MFKVFAGISPILVAATMAAGAAEPQQSTAARENQTSPAAPVTVVGCVVRNGAIDPNKGTRTLDLAPGALALTNARVLATGERTGGSPAAPPQDTNTGTIPQRTIVDGGGTQPSALTFALTGDHSTALGDLVGRRVEVVGRVGAVANATAARGTSGQRDAAPVPGVGTREERPSEGTAHPSAELRSLDVVSFRGVTGGCQ